MNNFSFLPAFATKLPSAVLDDGIGNQTYIPSDAPPPGFEQVLCVQAHARKVLVRVLVRDQPERRFFLHEDHAIHLANKLIDAAEAVKSAQRARYPRPDASETNTQAPPTQIDDEVSCAGEGRASE